MLIQACSSIWDKKLLVCKSEKDRNALMLRSGKETAARRVNMKTMREFYRPAVGKFIIYDEEDTLKFDNVLDAITKGKQLRKQLQEELNTLTS